ncbi:hypothetical protein [Microbacterium resistens]|uniref:hypothetical protein n=1 Tax=Microbacterium resistens TaxID=156977 RepID=UPI00366F5CE8
MSEPQVWVLIGVFAAAMFGMITVVSTMFIHVIKSEIGGLRAELIGEIRALDRDVSALYRHVLGIDRD